MEEFKTAAAVFLSNAGPPPLAELICRGDRASKDLAEIVEESRQQRQALLFNIASVRRAARSILRGPTE
jgi:hypothetical protein